MKTGIAILTLAAACACAAANKLEDREPFHHTFSNDASLDVDEVSGWIVVTGDSGNTIRVDGEKIVRADTAEALARGKSEVVLDVNEKNGTAQLYVNGPFRNNNHGFHEHGEHYEVTYNFTIHVPRSTALRLHAVNGKIEAEDTAGNYDVRTVNGGITMKDIAGSGSVETLNGTTNVTFRENPKAESLFKTFNGHVDVSFLPGLSANLHVKTFNGSAYTDFDATALASGAARSANLRVGAGGPDLKFETFNGTIKIHKLGN